MHRRFRGAPTTELRSPNGAVQAVVARNFRLRLLGLMGLGATEIAPLLFPRCRSIHMYGMKTPIDLVWLALEGDQGTVLEVVMGLETGRQKRAPCTETRRSIAALELSPGEAQRLGLLPGVAVAVN
jgi:uncharacterized membrane protein (UPF0127 family)